MTPIPERILEEARTLWNQIFHVGPAGSEIQSIAEAIAAAEQRGKEMEREECAAIVNREAERRYAESYQQGGARAKRMGLSAQGFVLEQMVSAIRSRSEGKGSE